jgi:hypothetical protein
MKVKALEYYMHDGPAAFRFELAERDALPKGATK